MKNKIALLLASLITVTLMLSLAPTSAMAATKATKLQVLTCKSGYHVAQDAFTVSAGGDPSLTVSFTGTWCTNGVKVATSPTPIFKFSGVCGGFSTALVGCKWKEVSQIGAWNAKIKAFLVNEQTVMQVGTNITLPKLGDFVAGYGNNSYLFQIGMSPKGYFVNIKGHTLPAQLNS